MDPRTKVSPDRFDAVLFDLDGVLTSTHGVQTNAWRETLDRFLVEWDAEHGTSTAPFEPADYVRHLKGHPRQVGAKNFLAARGIRLPEGHRDSPPGEHSYWGVGNAKRRLVEQVLVRSGVENYPGTIAWVRQLRKAGIHTGLISSSRDARAAIQHAGVMDLFDVAVDGRLAEQRGLRRMPEPDMLLEAARILRAEPARTAVVESAATGIEAGRRGGFGLIIAVVRAHEDADAAEGADLVVGDLAELLEESADAAMPAGPRAHRLVQAARRILAASDDYPTEPYRLVERAFNPEYIDRTETLLALGNGYLGIRGAFEERRPAYQPGTLLNGFYETRPIHYAEDGVGFARTAQSILYVPDGTRMRLLVDDEPLDCLSTEVVDFQRDLDMRTAELERSVIYQLPDGRRFSVRTTRFVSLAHRHLGCLRYEVTSLDVDTTLTMSSDLITHYRSADDDADPRRGLGFAEGVYEPVGELSHGRRAVLSLRTRRSGLTVAAAMDHEVDGDEVTDLGTTTDGDSARTLFRIEARVGRPVRIVKWLAYHHGRDVPEELRFRAGVTLDRAMARGYHEERRRHRAELDEFWRRSDIVVDGAPMLQQAVRYSLFSVLQATHRVEGHGVAAKGVTGLGYEGHYFWDTEIYVLPFLIHTNPQVARSLLLFRYRMLDAARTRAREVGNVGALYPWRTISGEEASAYYAAGTAQYHINADIAYALSRYVEATGDDDFLFRYGAEMLVETARLWLDLGHFSETHDGAFVVNCVTGPDEYTTVVDNNLYTNLMAAENLRLAVSAVQRVEREAPLRHQSLVERTALRPDELEEWRRAADAMYVPYDKRRGLHLQDEHFLDRPPWDFAGTPPDKHPLLLHFHPLVIYRHQVIKQADVVLATVLLPDRFSLEEKRHVFDYYDPLTTGDSSLSESIQSIAAAEIGEMRAAEEYLVDAVTVDVADRAGNVRDGVHVASAGGTWLAMVLGLAGMRQGPREPGGADADSWISFRPRLPGRLNHVGFRVLVHGSLLAVDMRREGVTYQVLEGGSVRVAQDGERHTVAPGAPVTLPLPARPAERRAGGR